MNRTLSRHLLAGVVAACVGTAFAAALSPAQTPTYVIDEPGINLDHARADLRRRMFDQAATDVRKAAARIDAEAKGADDVNRMRLKQDAGALLQAPPVSMPGGSPTESSSTSPLQGRRRTLPCITNGRLRRPGLERARVRPVAHLLHPHAMPRARWPRWA